MRGTFRWAMISIVAAILGMYTALNSVGWTSWLIMAGSAILFVGGLWQTWSAIRTKHK